MQKNPNSVFRESSRPRAPRAGFALPVTIIVLGVVLVSVVATMSIASLGVRRGASDERRGFQSLLVAESGLNTFQQYASANIETFPVRGVDNDEEWAAALNTWLASSGLESVAVGDASAALSVSNTTTVVPETGDPFDVITLNSVSVTGSGRHIAALDFRVLILSGDLDVFAPAALTSKPTIRVGGNARVSGSTGDESDWLGAASTTQNGSQITLMEGEATVPVTAEFASMVRPGEYVELTDGSGVTARFRVTAKAETSLDLERVGDPNVVFTSIPAGAAITHVPLAVSASVVSNDGATPPTARIPVTYSEFFRPGSELVLDYGGDEQRLEVLAVEGDELIVQAQAGSDIPSVIDPLYEGTTMRSYVVGAISEGGITVVGASEISPPEEEFASLPEDLVLDTFGVDVAGLRAIAQEAGGYFDDWSSVPDVEALSGITFIENSSNSNVQFCGSGIVFVNGDLMSNNSGCPFTGLVFVLGDWSERGNRQIQGAVVVEGIVETCSEVDGSGNCITDIMGTGKGSDKIEYDPLVLYNLGFDLAASQVSVLERPGTWRLVGAN